MRVFVTGATGFIGLSVVRELLSSGHQVTGLARSRNSASVLEALGAKAVIGTVEAVDILARAASEADAAIHTAYYHQLSHAPLTTRLRVFLGGPPSQVFSRFMAAAVATDKRALTTLGQALAKRGGALAAAFGTLAMTSGRLAIEDDPYDQNNPLTSVRARNEDVLQHFAAQGVRTSAIRLSPIVHGPGAYGLASMMFQSAAKHGRSAYLGDGTNRWPAVHRDDVARLFRLAIEKGEPGRAYHGVDEEGVEMKAIAAAIGRRLSLPVVALPQREAARHFGFISPMVGVDNPTSSALTRKRLGWQPQALGLIADLEAAQLG